MSNLTNQQSHDLPNEILQHTFTFLPLKSLIVGRAVSQHWRGSIPHAGISPIRRALLDFYLTLISSPNFRQTRPWVLTHLQPFDRQAYINDLMTQHPYIPEAFRVWIMEWPAKAVIGRVWPGLPNVYFMNGHCLDEFQRREGKNWLTPASQTVRALQLQKRTSKAAALPISLNCQGSVWLVLDQRDTFRDKVYTFPDGSRQVWDEDRSTEWDVVDAGWIEWQRRTWSRIEAWISASSSTSGAFLTAEE